MDHNSSTSNSKSRIELWLILILVVAAAVYWAFDDIGGRYLSESIASRFGETLIEKSRGKVTEPAYYILQRLHECIYLPAMAIGIVLGILLTSRLLSRFVNRNWLWLPLSLVAFAGANVFVGAAGETGTFWVVLFAGSEDSKQPGFQISRVMHCDSSAKQRVVVLGSSQGGTEVEETLLNREFGPNVYTSNLNYAGAQTMDFLLVRSWYAGEQPDVAICYLSELNFYTPVSGSRLLPLLKPSSWRDLNALESWRFKLGDKRLYGYLGSILPAFQSRRSLEYFTYGTPAVEPSVSLRRRRAKEKEKSPPSSAVDPLEEKAVAAALTYRILPDTDFHKRALERFLVESEKAGTAVVLIAGQINPIVSRKLDPAIRRDFLGYLKGLPEKYSNVTVLTDELPSHRESEYEDLMHITEEAQLRYTSVLADVLERRFGWKRLPSKNEN